MVKDGDKVKDEFVAGRAGMYYGCAWAAAQGAAVKLSFPDAEVAVVEPFNEDGSMAVQLAPSTINDVDVVVVRKGYEHPEALIKMTNLAADCEEEGEIYENTKDHDVFGRIAYGNTHEGVDIQVFKYYLVWPKHSEENVGRQRRLEPYYEQLKKAATKEEGEAIMETIDHAHTKDMFRRAIAWYFDKDPGLYGFWKNQGIDGSVYKSRKIYESKEYIRNAYDAPPTETMITDKASLDDLFKTMAVKVVSGEDISLFDDYVEQWKALGGEDITKEVNEWYKNK